MSLIQQLEWDSSFFEMPIGRLREGVTAEEIASAVCEADDRGLHCVYLLASAADQALLDAALTHGFMVVDLRVELDRLVFGHPAETTGLRVAHIGDLVRLAPIAREAFRGTRFFADKHFPVERSAELYVEWLRRGLTSEPDRRTFVCEDERGFVVCRIDASSGSGAIEMIAVAGDATRRGYGHRLVAGAGALFTENGLTTATVITQGRNIDAQRLYQSNGYRTSKMSFWLHRWAARPS